MGKIRISGRRRFIGRGSAFVAGACKSGEWSNRRGRRRADLLAARCSAARLASRPAPPPVYYAPEPVYVEEPVCRVVRERYWDGYGWVYRRVEVCN